MRFRPHSYQDYAIAKIIEQPACSLFLDMGMGKTISTLTAIQELMFNFFEVSKVLIIAPLRVAKMTWSQEVEKWDHLNLSVSKVLGTQKQRLLALEADADIYIINRENTEWLVNHYNQAWPFDMVVIDELSSFKSNKSRRFKALRKVRPLVKRIVGLTGTPTPNGLIDLWPQIYLLDRGARLGKSITKYRQDYFTPGRKDWQTGVVYDWKIKEESEKRIYDQINDICVSMKAEDYLEVPELQEIIIDIELSKKDMETYRKMERDLLLPLQDETEIEALTAAALSNKLLQMANGAVYDTDKKYHLLHDEKLKALEEIIEAANGKPVLVFYNYKHDFDRITKHFEGVRTLNTDEDIQDWNNGDIQILCVHPASAGHGLNLQQGGNIIVWFGLNWSLELYQQANARLHRQGQTSKVKAYLLVAKETIDEDVVEALRGKDSSQQRLLEALKARLTKANEEVGK